MATIYEVAARAGVSPATVSRVLNGTRVRDDLAARVRRAADELRFEPSRTARSLRRRSSELIALLIPDIENPYFTSLARGVEDQARAAGFSVVLCNTDENPGRESDYLRVAASERMAGVVLVPSGETTDLSALAGRPIVAVDRSPHGHPVDTVTVDNEGAGYAATRALLERGSMTVACITGPSGVDTAEDRAAGWRRAVEEATGAPPSAGALIHGDFRFESGAVAMRKLLEAPRPPDGVVVANNLMGAGALRALQEDPGILGPEALAIVGDLPFSALAFSGAAVVRLPARELGARAALLLLGRISGESMPPRTVVLPSSGVSSN